MAEPDEEIHDPRDVTTQPVAATRASERRIGPYRILRELAHGGMGAVYLAARADDEYQKRVAIKLVKGGFGSQEVVRHFRRERQILAGLEHPNIARLLDGGSSEDELPYFVMEYIEGQAIDRYCDARKLSTPERLKLFRQVCAAVQHAHRNLVIHRDIKPSNILVTPDGTPTLLDFGIAKLLNPELSGEALHTATGMAMTPEYASPEQARGEPLTTATDVYSLGVVLYELLTGRLPYRLKSRQPLDVLKAVCEAEPERPSTAIERTEERPGPDGTKKIAATAASVSGTRDGTPERLRRRLRGDLDNILMMALRKEPHLRYPSVEALSEDLRHHLEGRPVAARRGGFGYQALKFVRRNKLGVVAAATVAIVMVGFGVAMAAQSRRLAIERDKAERIAAFLVDLFKISEPSEVRGNTITAREVLDRGAEKIGKELKNQPEVRAMLQHTVGEVYSSLGLYNRAAELLQEALNARRSLGTESLEDAAMLRTLGYVLDEKGNYSAAESRYREALALQRKLVGDQSAEVGRTLHSLGATLQHKGDLAAAETFDREALALQRKLLGDEHTEVAKTLGSLAIVLALKGDATAAEPLFREVLEIHRKTLGSENTTVANDLNNLGAALGDKGDWAAAEQVHRETLAMKRRLFGEEHPRVADSLNNVGFSLYAVGRYDEAEAFLRQAISMRTKMLGSDHPLAARSMSNLGNVLREKGDPPGAEALHREALAIQRKRLGDEHPLVSETSNNLALDLADQGQRMEAEALLRRSLAVARKTLGERHANAAEIAVNLAALLLATGRAAEAEELARGSVPLVKAGLPKGNPSVAVAESVLGACLLARGAYDEAEGLLVGSYAVLAARAKQSPDGREALRRVIRLYDAWRKPDKAAEYRVLLAERGPSHGNR